MRVAFLTNFIPPYRIRLYEALMQAAGALRVFISTPMESNRQWTADWGTLDVVRQRTLTLKRKWRTPSFTEDYELHIPYDTMTQLRRWRPDVVLTGEMGARTIQAVAYARLTRTPVAIWAMLSERTEAGRSGLRMAARRWLVNNVDCIIVNGESGARYLHGLGVPDEKLLRVNQSLDMNAFLALEIERPANDEFQLLHVGTLSERKGVRSLLEGVYAWAAAHPEQKVRLTMVGDGPLAAELKLERAQRPASLAIDWIGNVPYDELPRWYGRADALVFPSQGDEWGLVVNEALASGVPVLGSTYAQAVEELIRDGENGWVFTPDSAAAVADALGRVLQTAPSQLRAMRQAARASVRELTPERAAARIAARLASLVP